MHRKYANGSQQKIDIKDNLVYKRQGLIKSVVVAKFT